MKIGGITESEVEIQRMVRLNIEGCECDDNNNNKCYAVHKLPRNLHVITNH